MGGIHQKGANGLVAEYRCAVTLNQLLSDRGVVVVAAQANLERLLSDAVSRVANELTQQQLDRAYAQGDALAHYLDTRIIEDPLSLGLLLPGPIEQVLVKPVGHNTNSGDPRDLHLAFVAGAGSVELPISLKAYRGAESSLGSKSARASLSRLFLGEESAPDAVFEDFFETAGSSFLSLLADFKQVANTFYAAPEGVAFVDAYERRKGTRKVNNPLRRKELGNYFTRLRGFKSEHRFADLYVQMFDLGKRKADVQKVGSETFVSAMRFILGNPDMLVLDAKADDFGNVTDVVNSLQHPTYRALNLALRPGRDFALRHKPNSSIIGVEIHGSDAPFKALSLAIWKDATIQYKLNTSRKL